MTFTDSRELHRSILANPYLPAHLREQAANDRSEYCRAEDDDDLLEIDRLTDPGLVRFFISNPAAHPCTWTCRRIPPAVSPIGFSTIRTHEGGRPTETTNTTG